MSSGTGNVSTDPLFVGLTRPPMIFGVSFSFFFLNFFFSLMFYINHPGIAVIGIAISLHVIGYIICFKEPLFMELYMNYASKCTKCSNRIYYGGNSYDVY